MLNFLCGCSSLYKYRSASILDAHEIASDNQKPLILLTFVGGIYFVKITQIPEDLSLGITFSLFTLHFSLKPRGFGGNK